MIITLLILTAVAVFTPQVLGGIRVKGVGTALGVAAVFVVLNLLIGWLLKGFLTLLALPLIWITLGLVGVVVTAGVNALMLKWTAGLIDSFEIDGWLPAFGMGLLFAFGAQLARFLN
ncbi:MAG: phage holin family protein [Acidobacteriota bacterium]